MNQIRVIVIMSILGALFEIWYLNGKKYITIKHQKVTTSAKDIKGGYDYGNDKK